MATTVRKQREMKVGAQIPVSFCVVKDCSPGHDVIYICVMLSILINKIRQSIYRHAQRFISKLLININYHMDSILTIYYVNSGET